MLGRLVALGRGKLGVSSIRTSVGVNCDPAYKEVSVDSRSGLHGKNSVSVCLIVCPYGI